MKLLSLLVIYITSGVVIYVTSEFSGIIRCCSPSTVSNKSDPRVSTMARGSRRINGGLRNKQADNDETLQPQEELDQNEDTTPKPLKKDPKKMNQTRPSPQEEFDEENDGCTPLGNQSIELWNSLLVSRDNLVTTVVSTSKGYFLIEADNEWRSSFYLKAYHQCGLSKEQIYEKCKRVTKIKVDKKFTNNNRMQQLPSWDMDAENKANDKIQC